MLYLAIPAHNEVATIGVLLWRLRTVLAEFPREYEVVVYDDASTDETADVAEQYAHAMPVTVLRGASRIGYAGALDALVRHVSAQTRYPRRDAMLLMQGDFTDPPGLVPEFARRFEGGADLVVGERLVVADAPVPVRRLFKAAHWAMRPFVRVDGVRDVTASMRLIRISALRDLVRQAGSAPVCVGDSWTANADLLLKLVPLARRVESVPLEPTYGVRMRETRRIAVRDGLAVLKWAWGARGRRAEAGSAADASGEGERRPPRGGAAGKRRDEPELSVEKLRERVRERPRVEDEESFNGRREGRRRERERARSERADETAADKSTERGADGATERAAERPAPAPEAPRTERAAAPERARREEPKERPERTKPERGKRERAAGTEGEAKTIRPERLPRGQRAARGDAPAAPRRARNDERSPYSDPTVALDDPFAPPAGRRGTRHDGTADTTPADGNTPAETEPMSAPGASRVLESMSVSPLSHAESGNTGDEDAGDGADGDESEGSTETAEGTGVRRKRRRNRRSRRGRARKDGAAGDEGSDEAGDTQGDDAGNDSGNASGDAPAQDGAPTARPDRPRRTRSRGAAVPTAEGEETPDGDADDRDDSAEVAGESEEERAARARRRGRRGRRGGARRSRGRRDKDGGESGESGPGDGERGGGSDGGGSDGGGSDGGGSDGGGSDGGGDAGE